MCTEHSGRGKCYEPAKPRLTGLQKGRLAPPYETDLPFCNPESVTLSLQGHGHVVCVICIMLLLITPAARRWPG